MQNPLELGTLLGTLIYRRIRLKLGGKTRVRSKRTLKLKKKPKFSSTSGPKMAPEKSIYTRYRGRKSHRGVEPKMFKIERKLEEDCPL